MNGWRIFWIVAALLGVAGVAVNLHDIKRYIKIRSM